MTEYAYDSFSAHDPLRAAPDFAGIGAVPQPAWTEVQGYVSVLREHVPWASPENLVRDLRSSDDQTRLKALLLLGLSDNQAHIPDWSDTTSTRVVGQHVAMPDLVELTYAALGDDDTQQAMPRSELVLRASDGGSGLYVQDEAHFRVHKGELQMVLGFTSRYRECNGGVPMGLYCTIERRWFSTTEVVDDRGRRGSGGVLVEGRGRFAAKALAGSLGDVDDLENRYLSRFTCIGYWWNPDRFVYQRLKANPVECDKPAY